MLRELSQLLGELHDGLIAVQARGGVSLTRVEMVLPLELRPVLRDGGCVLLADVARSRDVNAWCASPSKLRLAWTMPATGAADEEPPQAQSAAMAMSLIPDGLAGGAP